jgi:hypothetical protein
MVRAFDHGGKAARKKQKFFATFFKKVALAYVKRRCVLS